MDFQEKASISSTTTTTAQQATSGYKKPQSLLALIQERVDKAKIRDYFLKYCSNIPQEFRLTLWKIFLGTGIPSPFKSKFNQSDLMLKEHYDYMRHIVTDALAMGAQLRRADELNYLIYLLDRGCLPLNEADIMKGICRFDPFRLVYKQLSETVDDHSESDAYFLSFELCNVLQRNLPKMKSIFEQFMRHNELTHRVAIAKINVDPLLLSGLACLFSNSKMYHIIWDRVVMGEFELLVFTLISLLESMKEDTLRMIEAMSGGGELDTNLIRHKLGVDQSKVLRKAAEYYCSSSSGTSAHGNSHIYNLIINYFYI